MLNKKQLEYLIGITEQDMEMAEIGGDMELRGFLSELHNEIEWMLYEAGLDKESE